MKNAEDFIALDRVNFFESSKHARRYVNKVARKQQKPIEEVENKYYRLYIEQLDYFKQMLAKANGGDLRAQRIVGEYFDGLHLSMGDSIIDKEEALYYYEKSAKQGDHIACLAMAYKLKDKNKRLAKKYYRVYKSFVNTHKSDCEMSSLQSIYGSVAGELE